MFCRCSHWSLRVLWEPKTENCLFCISCARLVDNPAAHSTRFSLRRPFFWKASVVRRMKRGRPRGCLNKWSASECAGSFFLNCTKNTELTKRMLARTFSSLAKTFNGLRGGAIYEIWTMENLPHTLSGQGQAAQFESHLRRQPRAPAFGTEGRLSGGVVGGRDQHCSATDFRGHLCRHGTARRRSW